MLLFTVEDIKRDVELLGTVKGSTVRTKNILKDFGAGLRNIVGGEMKAYTEMLEESREIATEKMIADARKLGADGIIGIRYTTSSVMDGCTEVLAFGTAVKFK